MFRLILLFISLAIFWGGGQSLYTNLSNSEATEISCAAFLDGTSGKDWFKLTDCYSASTDIIMVYDEGDAGTQSEFFLPLYASEADIGSKPVKAFMEITSGAEKLKVVQIMNAQDGNQDLGKFYEENPETATFINRRGILAINGLRTFGIEVNDDTRDTLVKGAGNDNFIIIAQNTEPDPMGMSLSILGFGFLIFFWVMWSFSRQEDEEEGGEEA
jgi:hypothetical protein